MPKYKEWSIDEARKFFRWMEKKTGVGRYPAGFDYDAYRKDSLAREDRLAKTRQDSIFRAENLEQRRLDREERRLAREYRAKADSSNRALRDEMFKLRHELNLLKFGRAGEKFRHTVEEDSAAAARAEMKLKATARKDSLAEVHRDFRNRLTALKEEFDQAKSMYDLFMDPDSPQMDYDKARRYGAVMDSINREMARVRSQLGARREEIPGFFR